MSQQIQQGLTKNPDGIKAILTYDAQKKSALIAYLIWFFLGIFAVHRFYLGETKKALIFIASIIIGSMIQFVMVVPIIWWIVDAFLIPGLTQRYNTRLANEIHP